MVSKFTVGRQVFTTIACSCGVGVGVEGLRVMQNILQQQSHNNNPTLQQRQPQPYLPGGAQPLNTTPQPVQFQAQPNQGQEIDSKTESDTADGEVKYCPQIQGLGWKIPDPYAGVKVAEGGHDALKQHNDNTRMFNLDISLQSYMEDKNEEAWCLLVGLGIQLLYCIIFNIWWLLVNYVPCCGCCYTVEQVPANNDNPEDNDRSADQE